MTNSEAAARIQKANDIEASADLLVSATGGWSMKSETLYKEAAALRAETNQQISSKAAPKLPQGWRVEMLGLINAVQFECWDTCKLLWCDGVWTVVNGAHSMPARGVATASTMAEARKNGTDFISKLEA